MARTYGEYKRAVARIEVLRGYEGNETSAHTLALPPKDGEGIKSGMLISADGNGEWVKGCPAGKVPHFAWHDQDDTDVDSSGKLLGLSCAGDYVIQTGWFDETGGAITNADFLKAGLTTYLGYVVGCAITDDADKIGKVHQDGIVDLFGVKSGVTVTSGSINVLTLITNWQPNQAPGAYALV